MIVSTGLKIARFVARCIFISSILFIPSSCQRDSAGFFSNYFNNNGIEKNLGFQEIKTRGTLIAAATFNTTDYFMYHGEPMGYQFDQLQMFADYLGVKLQVKACKNLDEAFRSLADGECDLIGIGLTVNKEQSEFVDFAEPQFQTHEVLVQRKPHNWRKMKSWAEVESEMVSEPSGLSGKTVYIERGSPSRDFLASLPDEVRDGINLVEDPSRNTEQLIQSVASGEIDFTICNEYVAQAYENYYPELDIQTPIGSSNGIAWAFPKGSDSLRASANTWLSTFKQMAVARYLYDRYFNTSQTVQTITYGRDFSGEGTLSKYDDIIRRISKKYGLDWRLMASIIYQESQFQPEVYSWKGAFGLMQMMPSTASKYGIDKTSTVAEQIEAGARFLRVLDKELKDDVPNPEERMKFVLAAYNAGIAHIFDARRLAKKYGRNPDIWNGNVDYYVLNKSNPLYYKDTSVVRFGYARGEETFNFVNSVLNRFEYYKKTLDH